MLHGTYKDMKDMVCFLCQVVGTPCYISPELCEGKPYPYRVVVFTNKSQYIQISYS